MIALSAMSQRELATNEAIVLPTSPWFVDVKILCTWA